MLRLGSFWGHFRRSRKAGLALPNEDLKFKSRHLHDNGKPENEILLLQDILPCIYCYCFISEKGVLKCIY